jgi:hypothetical protein
MICRIIMDKVFESDGPFSIWARLEILIHRLRCPRCARKIDALEMTRDFMKTGFFPPSPGFEEPVMAALRDAEFLEVHDAAPDIHGVSFRSWVITGIIIVVSLSASFFGLDFAEISANHGLSFLLPVGLTMGIVVTGYGALFIGSHLKELSARFRLR